MSNLSIKLGGIDYSEYDLKALSSVTNKEWKDIIKTIQPIIKGMDEDMYSTCVDKIMNIYDKYLNIEGEPNLETAAKILKDEMERDNGPTWICIIGTGFAFNIKSQKEACLYCYLGHFGILLYKC